MAVYGEKPDYRLTPQEDLVVSKYLVLGKGVDSPVPIDIFVEGESDVYFYKKWLQVSRVDKNKKFAIKIQKIKKRDSVSGARGNYMLVIEGAKNNRNDPFKLYIVDRDTRDEDEVQEYADVNNLFFTDFPAIESYGFSDTVLKELNYRKFDNCYKSLSNCYGQIAQLLKLLYFVRRLGGTVAWGKSYKTISNLILNRSFKDYISSEEYDEMMHETIKSVEDVFEVEASIFSLESGDPRKYAYGHDVAKIIKCLIVKEEEVHKSSYPTYAIHHLETAITNIYIDMKLYEDDQLFRSILEYINFYAMVNSSI